MPLNTKGLKRRFKRPKKNHANADQTISFERSRLLSLINSMADAVIAIDQNGRVQLYNGAALDLLNTNASLTNRKLTDVLTFYGENDKPVDVIKGAQKAGHAVKREDLHFLSNENQKVALYLDIAPIYSDQAHRQSGGYILLLRDITKQKTLDEERTEFISVTSHELRTPIAIAEANISTALLPDLAKGMSKQAKELLNQAHNQVVFLGDLVNDLTTLARAERGGLALEVEPIRIKPLLEKLAQDYAAEAKDRKLKLIVEPATAEHTIYSSELYVHEILQNFVTNALKYTQAGQITLGAQWRPQSVTFSVKDTGIGIAAGDKAQVFSKFYRAEDYRTRATRGTGLGLYITVKLAQRIHGRVWFKSKLNQGSIFYLEVPSLKQQSKAAEKS